MSAPYAQRIDEYLARTSTEGRERVAASMRRLEVRIGHLLGPAPGRGRSEDTVHGVIEQQRRGEFRKMAAHPDIVEAVIADSTDTNPPSRARILAGSRGKPGQDAISAAPEIGEASKSPHTDPKRAALGGCPVPAFRPVDATFPHTGKLEVEDQRRGSDLDAANLLRARRQR